MQKSRQQKARRAEQAQIRAENAKIAKRNKYLPGIRKIAKRYHAGVEVLDTHAYIFKTVGKRQAGVHIPYGTHPRVIIRKLEVAFTPSAGTSKIIKGISSAAHKAKAIREDLDKAGKDIKSAMGGGKGNMWTDPDYFKNFGR